MDQEVSDNIMFFGRFHPLILHLPIGFLVIAFILEVLSRFNRFRQYRPAVGFALLLGAVFTILAAALGHMLAQGGGYNENLLLFHRWAGITLAVTAVVAFILYRELQRYPSVWLDKVYMSVLVMMMITLSVAGHFGGALTHGSEYLTEYMPKVLRSITGVPEKRSKVIHITNLNEAPVFDDIIYPILDTKCISCHNESKRKGELVLSTPETLLEGGENGSIFIAGEADRSEIIRRIQLPEIDEDHMPPSGKKQITDEELGLLSWWINEGASFDKRVADLNVNAEIQPILNALVDPDANKSEVDKLLARKIKPVDQAVFQELQSRALILSPISADNNWLEATFSNGFPRDSLFEVLMPVIDQLTWLDLGNTVNADDILPLISKFQNLTRLHLENTDITDQGLQHLKNLTYLEYLNIHGTDISDEGIQHLSGLKNLRKLYVWRTLVTKQGASQLKKNLSGLEINLGIEDVKEAGVTNPVVKEIDKKAVGKTSASRAKNEEYRAMLVINSQPWFEAVIKIRKRR